MKLILFLLFLVSCAKDHYYRKTIPDEKLKLCFIGDTGTGKEVQKDVARLLSEEKCHTIHFLGDIIYPRGLASVKDKKFKKRFFDLYGPIAKKDHKPILYMIMGNHDHRRSISHWNYHSRKHPEIFFPNPYYVVELNKDICLVHLDTDYYKLLSNFFVAWTQTSWLEDRQEEIKDCRLKIALTHHPYKNTGKKHGHSSGWLKHFQDDNIIGKFDYLISGHEHFLSDEGVEKGTHLLISGAGGNTERIEDGGYLVLEIDKDRVDYKFRKLSK